MALEFLMNQHVIYIAVLIFGAFSSKQAISSLVHLLRLVPAALEDRKISKEEAIEIIAASKGIFIWIFSLIGFIPKKVLSGIDEAIETYEDAKEAISASS